ncbi:hypothetical protein Z517_03106 [Fonsecaea pedrosoi CBS 271.37]|uniref:Uncharacterized protein n=1 Tax=Fonsecaea pedrosoi CBS 271.37 TaxID=1442368 RepID=A0A0D2GZ24_9EURO|nr:uncharacterized protein Z517_03106 [Fonsecaea pedrosoi CBS 271.37]KIW83860.1 hypothetical protein Z517_03106 [Fonsecaea pedrosoi CBS 271.37]
MASPPSYSATADPGRERLPPYKASHGFANSREELAALKEFAESKLYVDAGSNGMLPDLRGGAGGLQSLAWGGPMGSRGPYWEVGWPEPESKEERKRRKEQEKQRKKEEKEREKEKEHERRGSVAERLMRVISRGSSKDGDTVS